MYESVSQIEPCRNVRHGIFLPRSERQCYHKNTKKEKDSKPTKPVLLLVSPCADLAIHSWNTIMITVKTLLGKLNSLPFSDEEMILNSTKKLDRSRIKCSACGAVGRCRPVGTYKRMMITVVHGARNEVELQIPRICCESCRHTHALISDILVPYGSYTLRFILHILSEYLKRNEPVAQLCERWAISISTLYGWIHLFLEQHNIWFRVLDRISWITGSALERIGDIPEFTAAFYLRFRFSFMQQITTQSRPIGHGGGRFFLP